MEKRNNTYYDILGVSRFATLKEIKDAYRKKVMYCHPDNSKTMDESLCHEMMCLLNKAYSILRDIELREAYDERIEGEEREDDSPIEPKTKTKERSSRREFYEYYNSVDYDDVVQEDFVSWISNFSADYIDLVLRYVFSKGLNSYGILDILYETFGNIIDYEQIKVVRINKSL